MDQDVHSVTAITTLLIQLKETFLLDGNEKGLANCWKMKKIDALKTVTINNGPFIRKK